MPKLQIACVLSLIPLLASCGEDRALPERIDVRMTGSGYRWEIRHAGWDSKFGTDDDVVSVSRLKLPVGIPVQVSLKPVQ